MWNVRREAVDKRLSSRALVSHCLQSLRSSYLFLVSQTEILFHLDIADRNLRVSIAA